MGPAGDRVRFLWFLSLHHWFVPCEIWMAGAHLSLMKTTGEPVEMQIAASFLHTHWTKQPSKGRMNLHTWGIGRIRLGVDWNIQTGTTCCLCRTDSAKESWKKKPKQLRNLSWTFLFQFSLSKKESKNCWWAKIFRMWSLFNENEVNVSSWLWKLTGVPWPLS